MTKNIRTAILILCLGTISYSPTECQTILYPGVMGAELAESIQMDYTPVLNLTYSEARDTLYSKIDVVNDTIYAIYSNFGAYLTPGLDPTVTLFDQGINTEHIYPQGKGATDGTPPYFNMYNLAASRVDVNQARANLPFDNIPDGETDTWYMNDISVNSIPGQNIDSYSESTSSAFEPRESVKGNIARSMFYTYTIYRDQIDLVDPDYFQSQQEVLCEWHFLDPVDQSEQDRNESIADYQDNKSNPFVLDCTLAERLYCGASAGCMSAAVSLQANRQVLDFRSLGFSGSHVLVNPAHNERTIDYIVYTMEGFPVMQETNRLIRAHGFYQLPHIEGFGIFLLVVESESGEVGRFLMRN